LIHPKVSQGFKNSGAVRPPGGPAHGLVVCRPIPAIGENRGFLAAISTTAIVAIAKSYGESRSMPTPLKKVLRLITKPSHL
jgi:hypothetical protein